ncbi:hypothetical protein LSAT2_011308, partial [Lamellibrachia satsuma]
VQAVIRGCPDEQGISVNNIAQKLRGLPPQSLKEAIEFLSGEGHIYSTVDDEHYRSTDAILHYLVPSVAISLGFTRSLANRSLTPVSLRPERSTSSRLPHRFDPTTTDGRLSYKTTEETFLHKVQNGQDKTDRIMRKTFRIPSCRITFKLGYVTRIPLARPSHQAWWWTPGGQIFKKTTEGELAPHSRPSLPAGQQKMERRQDVSCWSIQVERFDCLVRL